MNKIFLLGEDTNLLSSFEAKLGLKNYSVFINSLSEPSSSIALNVFLNQALFLIFFLHENSINNLEILKDLKSNLDFEIPIFLVADVLEKKLLDKLDLLNIKYCFSLEKHSAEEIIEKILKINKNIYKND